MNGTRVLSFNGPDETVVPTFHRIQVSKEVEMRSSSRSDQLARQQIKEGPKRDAWWKEEIKFEIERLKAILRNADATEEERAIAQSQIANYQEMTEMTGRPAADWLLQMDLLAA